MLGALYASVLFFAIINALVVQPVISAERAVSYRERAAGMYSFAPWVLALVSWPFLSVCEVDRGGGELFAPFHLCVSLFVHAEWS